MRTFLCGIIASMFFSQLHAHPTSYQGSFGVMGEHSSDLSHVQFNRSWRYWFATGIHHYRQPLSGDDKQATLFTTNFLLQRWNTSKLQANLYALGGGGVSNFDGDDQGVLYLGGQFDIEDRRLYFLSKYKKLFWGGQNHLETSSLRFGFAPYVAGSGALHTWLILDLSSSQISSEDRNLEITPTMRMFYQNFLFELGQSFNGNTKFNYITHF